MSRAATEAVWARSQLRSGALLLLLAVADAADDQGQALLSVAQLATKLRCSRRYVDLLLQTCQRAAELDCAGHGDLLTLTLPFVPKRKTATPAGVQGALLPALAVPHRESPMPLTPPARPVTLPGPQAEVAAVLALADPLRELYQRYPKQLKMRQALVQDHRSTVLPQATLLVRDFGALLPVAALADLQAMLARGEQVRSLWGLLRTLCRERFERQPQTEGHDDHRPATRPDQQPGATDGRGLGPADRPGAYRRIDLPPPPPGYGAATG